MQSGATDVFGHKYLDGTTKALELAVKERFGCKVRSVELNLPQRCASHIASLADISESFGVGSAAVGSALDGDSDFSDWSLVFGEECEPDQIEIAPSGLQSGVRWSYPLKDRQILPLSHDLFQIDGIFMARMARSVTLRSGKSARSVTLEYPEMPYLGIWHSPQTNAPFVCIEPWCGLPDYDNRPVDFSKKAQMFHIEPNAEKTVGYDIIFL